MSEEPQEYVVKKSKCVACGNETNAFGMKNGLCPACYEVRESWRAQCGLMIRLSCGYCVNCCNGMGDSYD